MIDENLIAIFGWFWFMYMFLAILAITAYKLIKKVLKEIL